MYELAVGCVNSTGQTVLMKHQCPVDVDACFAVDCNAGHCQVNSNNSSCICPFMVDETGDKIEDDAQNNNKTNINKSYQKVLSKLGMDLGILGDMFNNSSMMQTNNSIKQSNDSNNGSSPMSKIRNKQGGQNVKLMNLLKDGAPSATISADPKYRLLYTGKKCSKCECKAPLVCQVNKKSNDSDEITGRCVKPPSKKVNTSEIAGSLIPMKRSKAGKESTDEADVVISVVLGSLSALVALALLLFLLAKRKIKKNQDKETELKRFALPQSSGKSFASSAIQAESMDFMSPDQSLDSALLNEEGQGSSVAGSVAGSVYPMSTLAVPSTASHLTKKAQRKPTPGTSPRQSFQMQRTNKWKKYKKQARKRTRTDDNDEGNDTSNESEEDSAESESDSDENDSSSGASSLVSTASRN